MTGYQSREDYGFHYGFDYNNNNNSNKDNNNKDNNEAIDRRRAPRPSS